MFPLLGRELAPPHRTYRVLHSAWVGSAMEASPGRVPSLFLEDSRDPRFTVVHRGDPQATSYSQRPETRFRTALRVQTGPRHSRRDVG